MLDVNIYRMKTTDSSSKQVMESLDEIAADKTACAHRLVAEYGDRLYETAIRLCGNESDAGDYVFRTLERAIERIDGFKGRASLFTWLYEIMVNLMRTDARRKAANALTFPGELPECEDPRPNAGAALDAKTEAEAVQAAIRELSPPLRATVVFRYYEDMTVSEIAHILSVPEGTVMRRLYDAKNIIRRRIERMILP